MSESLGAMIKSDQVLWTGSFWGIAAGFAADKIHSNPKVIGIGFSLMVIGIATFFVVPAEPKLLGLAAVTILVISLGLFMVRALYFAVIDEIKIPLKYYRDGSWVCIRNRVPSSDFYYIPLRETFWTHFRESRATDICLRMNSRQR